ncbi:hypothetical protein [Candidatus Laterigemmans baculatus]|uniref:hypothetical protein n=1 Tax=Candidatus Laterigemmans baculatus TaxID=2770505 RepID=UPI0013DD2701|nr:hypothetical protein [Candidatus Laterigemmans baculatus]
MKKKEMKWRMYRPAGLDLSGLAEKHHEYAVFFCSELIRRRIFDRQVMYREFVPVKRKHISPVFIPQDAYKPVRNFLIESGQVECDGYYTAGNKSFGYKLAEHLLQEPSTVVLAKKSVLRHKLTKYHEKMKRLQSFQPVHQHLRGWLERLEIDRDAAVDFLDYRRQQEEWGAPSELLAKKSQQRYLHAHASVTRIADGDFFFVGDKKYGRLHSNVTNLETELRPFLRLEGRQLVNIDIANSQPLFLCVLMGRYRGDLVSHCEVGKKSEDLDLVASLLTEPDVREYARLCQNGRIYEELADGKVGSRREVKESFFAEVLFGDTRGKRGSRQLREFTRRFPTVRMVIDEVKRRDYRHLAHTLQRVESGFVLHRVCKRLADEHPGVPLFTIHDSIMTLPGFVNIVRDVLIEEFNCLGLSPMLRKESYCSSVVSSPAAQERKNTKSYLLFFFLYSL